MKKSGPPKTAIRYSQSFKLKLVKEIERGEINWTTLNRKYGIKGKSTVLKWVKRYGCGKYGKVIRVEDVGEIDEERRLRQEVRKLKEALADAHIDLALEKAFFEMACRQLEQTPEAFKKKHAGRRRMG